LVGNAEVMHFGDYERERLKFPAALFSKFSSNAGIKIYVSGLTQNNFLSANLRQLPRLGAASRICKRLVKIRGD
jgi:hypothetical protein